MQNKLTPFHVALAVRDIPESREFYENVLNCKVGRSADKWVDFNLYGHQFSCHLNPAMGKEGQVHHHINPVDGQGVPTPHYGVVLEMSDWKNLVDRISDKVTFVIEPYIRFEGEIGEQATMFFCDPSGNALEFKAFKDIDAMLFAT